MNGAVPDPGPVGLLAPLERAVVETGALLARWRRDPAATSGAWEGDQFKARADAMAHEALSDRLRAIAPSLPVLSEEDPGSPPASRPPMYWLVDPIDGTASYAHGFRGYATQAALMAGAAPVAAAVCAPELNEGTVYTAARGHGARRDGRALAPRGRARSDGARRRILTDNTPEPRGVARAVHDRFGCTGYVERGSIALKLCAVADGTAELFVKDVAVRDWDVAAPHLLLAETGAALTRLDGTPFGYEGGFEHRGLVGAADPALAHAVARWARAWSESSTPDRSRGG